MIPTIRWGLLSLMSLLLFHATMGCQKTAAPALSDQHFTLAENPSAPILFPDTITLKNKTIRIGVSPDAGRIVDFGFADGPNILWINTSGRILKTARPSHIGHTIYNIGGDKIWPMIQALYRSPFGRNAMYPPDGVIDGQPWHLILQSENAICIESQLSPHLGIQVQRTIAIASDKPEITITNTITRKVANPHPVHIWSVTQVPSAQEVLLDLAPNRLLPNQTWIPLADDPVEYESVQVLPDKQAIMLTPTHITPMKAGTFGRWIAGIYPGYIFAQYGQYIPAGAYPDASNVQIFSDTKTRYMELETLSPFVQLQPGESVGNTITWRLLKYDTPLSPETLAAALTAQIPQ